MDKLKWILGTVNTFSLLLMFIWIAVTVPAEDMDFYSKEYDKYNIAQSIAADKNDLMYVTKHLVDYMMGRNDDLVVSISVQGELREFFNEKEKAHMVDVRNLFLAGHKIFMVSIGVFVLTAAMFLKKRYPLKDLAKSYSIVATVFLSTVLFLTGIIALNFEKAFTIFHEVFFANDLWLLDPKTDLLINIVPLGFFIDISIVAGSILGVFLIFLIIVSGVFIKFIKPKI